MKRFVIALLLALIVAFPIAAASNSFAVGLNLGAGASLAGQFQMDKLTINANLGYGFLGGYLSADAWADYRVADFDIGDEHFWVTAGAGANVGLAGNTFLLSAIAPVGVVYPLNNKDIPLDIYFRFHPGVKILPDLGFYWDAYFGAMWHFD